MCIYFTIFLRVYANYLIQIQMTISIVLCPLLRTLLCITLIYYMNLDSINKFEMFITAFELPWNNKIKFLVGVRLM